MKLPSHHACLYTATQLPTNFTHDLPSVVSAYTKCRLSDIQIVKDLQIDSEAAANKDLINIRILGYLLLYGPSQHAIAQVAKEIRSCRSDQDLIDLGQ